MIFLYHSYPKGKKSFLNDFYVSFIVQTGKYKFLLRHYMFSYWFATLVPNMFDTKKDFSLDEAIHGSLCKEVYK